MESFFGELFSDFWDPVGWVIAFALVVGTFAFFIGCTIWFSRLESGFRQDFQALVDKKEFQKAVGNVLTAHLALVSMQTIMMMLAVFCVLVTAVLWRLNP
jgi:hypothetical protein